MAALARVGPAVARKLVNLLGESGATELAEAVLLELGLARLDTANDRLSFGEALATRGGVTAVIGRSIATQALLHGAVMTLDAALAGRSRSVEQR